VAEFFICHFSDPHFTTSERAKSTLIIIHLFTPNVKKNREKTARTDSNRILEGNYHTNHYKSPVALHRK
jgi:hypothetical protein